MKEKPYASLISSVMYAQVCTMPDLAFVLSVLGRFQLNLGLAHWNAGKKVLRYMKRTESYVLCCVVLSPCRQFGIGMLH